MLLYDSLHRGDGTATGTKGHNDRYGWIDEAAQRLLADSADMLRDGDQGQVGDEAVARLLTAAIRLYAAKTDGEDRTFRPIIGDGDDEVSATELLTAVSELLRALNLSPMELAIWFRHRPENTGPLQNRNETRG